jgi:Right handed beta helix region/Protein of unknown function (DUF1565)
VGGEGGGNFVLYRIGYTVILTIARIKIMKKSMFIVTASIVLMMSASILFRIAGTGESHAAGNTYYVATNGNDGNPGTQTQPFRTIQKAANIVNPGDTVVVRDGTYQTSGISAMAEIRRSGAPNHWITFRAEHQWKAILDCAGATYWCFNVPTANIGYIRIEDFEMKHAKNAAAKLNASGLHHFVFKGNNFHHNTGAGALLGNARFYEIDSNYFHDNGGPEYVNHDHGLYSGGTDVMVKNNLFAHHVHGWAIQTQKGARAWKIINNTFVFPNPSRDGHIMLWRSAVNFLIENNIFYQPRGPAIVQRNANLSGTIVRNNLTTEAQIVGPGVTVTVSNNTLATDPMLANPSARDFHLKAGSPAIKKGASLPEVPCDYDGNKRPAGSAYDIGAYKFGASPSGSCMGGPTPTSSSSPTPTPSTPPHQ